MQAQFALLAARLAPPQPDGELLARYARDRDEVAFAALVHRHGPTVYGVCRRVLGNSADADDAFQVVFLVLAAKAGSLAHRPALGGWLHGVALRVAGKARTAFARLRKHERRAAETRPERAFDPVPNEPPAWLDRELAALPERYREPVVRCLIHERPRAEVAAELGIPEGTLASRLDTARKRLAGRLARHRYPMAFGGLLVSVPSELAGAAVSRATIGGVETVGAGEAIHQFAHEVTRTMVPTAKWATAISAGVVTTVGGLLLAAGGGQPPAPPPAGPPAAAVPPEPADPPEPTWMAAFRRAYELKDGEYVKRVAPPYIDERKEYMYRVWYPKSQTPEAKAVAWEQLDRQKLFMVLLLDFDGRRLTTRTSVASIAFCDVPELADGGKMLNVWNTVAYVTGRESPDIVIDPESVNHPLLSVEKRLVGGFVSVAGTPSVIGDFVTRKDAPLEKLVPQLETILREECGLDIRLTLKSEVHPVFVVGGTFKPNPPEWRPKKQLDVYATEEGLNKEYDHFALDNGGGEKLRTVNSSQSNGTPAEFVRSVGSRLRARMVWDAPLPERPRVSWIDHTVRNPTEEQAAADRDPDKVLVHVSEQTGLTFRKDVRRVEVLYLSAPEPK